MMQSPTCTFIKRAPRSGEPTEDYSRGRTCRDFMLIPLDTVGPAGIIRKLSFTTGLLLVSLRRMRPGPTSGLGGRARENTAVLSQARATRRLSARQKTQHSSEVMPEGHKDSEAHNSNACKLRAEGKSDMAHQRRRLLPQNWPCLIVLAGVLALWPVAPRASESVDSGYADLVARVLPEASSTSRFAKRCGSQMAQIAR